MTIRHAARTVAHLALSDLRMTLTDRQGAFFILLLPVVLSVVLGTVVGGDDGRLDVAITSGPDVAINRDLDAALAASPHVRIHRYANDHAVDAAVRSGEVDAGLLVPADYAARARSSAPLGLAVLTRPGDPAAGADRWVVEGALRAHLTRIVAQRAGRPIAPAPARRAAAPAPPSAGGYGYVLPANLVLFVFVNSLGAAGALAAARAGGITRRLVLAPVPTGVLLAALVAARTAVALFQAAMLIAVGRVVFGVHWGPVVPVAAVVVLFALVSAGAALVVGTTARSLEQAIAVGAPLGIVLGMLAGCMWPLSIVPPALRAVGHLVPHAWAVDALQALHQPGARAGAVTGDLAVLAAFAAAVLAVGALRLRASLTG